MAHNSLPSFTAQIEQKRAQAKEILGRQMDFTIDGYFDLLLLKGRSAANLSVSSTRSIPPENASNLIGQELAQLRDVLLEQHNTAIKGQLTAEVVNFAPFTFPSNAGQSVKQVIKVESGVIPCIDVPDDEEPIFGPKIKTEEAAQEGIVQVVNAQPANTGSVQMSHATNDDEASNSMASSSGSFTRNRVNYNVNNDGASGSEQVNLHHHSTPFPLPKA